MLLIEASLKNDISLKKILYISYLLCFYKNKKNKIWALLYFGSKINIILLAYLLKLGFKIHYINVKA